MPVIKRSNWAMLGNPGDGRYDRRFECAGPCPNCQLGMRSGIAVPAVAVRWQGRCGLCHAGKSLLPLALIATPNLPEARLLAELPDGSADECAAAITLLAATSDYRRRMVRNGKSISACLPATAPNTSHLYCSACQAAYHGSGCTLASALARSRLALGESWSDAVKSRSTTLRNPAQIAEQPGHGQ